MVPLVTRGANLTLASAGGVSSLALLYFLYYYEWKVDSEFPSRISLLVHYLVPASASILFFSSLRLQPATKARLALLTLCTAVSVSVTELMLEAIPERTLFTLPTKDSAEELRRIAERYGVEYDTRSAQEVKRDLRAKGIDAVPAVGPLAFLVRQPDGSLRSRFALAGTEILPLGGQSNSVTVLCNEAGDWVTYLSDEHGFHNPRGIWGSERVDIAALGGSFVQGACVPSDYNLVAIIRRRHPATLNLGMGNAGPLVALAHLKEYAAKFRPRIVLWFLAEPNDFAADLSTERDSPLLLRFLERGDAERVSHTNLLDLQPVIDKLLADHTAGQSSRAETAASRPSRDESGDVLPDLLRLGNLRARLGLIDFSGADASAKERMDQLVTTRHNMELLATILSHAKLSVSSWGGKVYLVYLPERERYAFPKTAELDDRIREHLLRLAGFLGIPVIDVHSAFESHGDPLSLFPFRRRGHYNVEGHRLIGETVLQSLAADESNGPAFGISP
jgi:hypothetical protein